MVNFVNASRDHYPFADSLSEVGCSVPFRHFEIYNDGHVAACCNAWLPEMCGNILFDDLSDIIQNPRRERIKQGMRNGCFEFCNDMCPELNQIMSFGTDASNSWSIMSKSMLDDQVRGQPYKLYLSYDASCNLQCPSCRTSIQMFNPNNKLDSHAAHLMRVHDRVKQLIDMLIDSGHAVHLSITGSGDAFASPIFWQYLQELSSKSLPANFSVDLQTNGVLMTDNNLSKIRNLWPYIRNILVSVDAATKETYDKIRVGGNFKKLCENLDNLDNLVANGNFENLEAWQTNFIVQAGNFRELKQFVEWQLGYKSIGRVWTNLITKWGHISDEQFARMAVWQKDHPARAELCAILTDPVFKNPKIRLGNLTALL